MFRISSLTFAAIVSMAVAPSQAANIAQNLVGTELAGAGNYYLGQSFTVEGTGSFTNVAVSFYTGYGASIPYADGQLFLYSSAYTGKFSQLGSGTGFLGSAVGSGSAYNFGPVLALNGGMQYFAYMNTKNPSAQYTGGNPYAGGETFQADSSSGFNFYAIPSVDLRFGVSGSSSAVAAVPEPASWAMLLLGFGAIGGAMRTRRQTVRYA